MRIGPADTEDRVVIVAEIGNNHEGDEQVAARLVDEAAAAGVDAVKFQTFRTELFASADDAARFAKLQGFELPIEAFGRLRDRAHGHGLAFVSTPLDLASADGLLPLVDGYKIASGDNDFVPLIDKLCATGKPLVLSAGLLAMDALRALADAIRSKMADPAAGLAVLHCVTAYPVPDEDANVAAVSAIAREIPGVVPGYSDHTLGIEACVLAVAAGARIIEKHFTLDQQFSDFRDHQLSADPAAMAELVARVRAASKLLGGLSKTVQPSEKPLEQAVRRTIVAARDLPAGHVVTGGDLMWTRPQRGLPPGSEHLLLGRVLQRAVGRGSPLLPDDLQAG